MVKKFLKNFYQLMEVHEKIKIDADRKGISTSKIGKEFGKAQQTISSWFNGTNAMPLDFFIWYVHEYGQDLDIAAIFNKETADFTLVKEKKTDYRKAFNKKKILEKISKILDEETL